MNTTVVTTITSTYDSETEVCVHDVQIQAPEGTAPLAVIHIAADGATTASEAFREERDRQVAAAEEAEG